MIDWAAITTTLLIMGISSLVGTAIFKPKLYHAVMWRPVLVVSTALMLISFGMLISRAFPANAGGWLAVGGIGLQLLHWLLVMLTPAKPERDR